jgi:hypothetical protein
VRRLSQQDLGLYKQAFFVVTTAMNLLPLGFAMSAFYFLPREAVAAAGGQSPTSSPSRRHGGLAAALLLWSGRASSSGCSARPELAGWPGCSASSCCCGRWARSSS